MACFPGGFCECSLQCAGLGMKQGAQLAQCNESSVSNGALLTGTLTLCTLRTLCLSRWARLA